MNHATVTRIAPNTYRADCGVCDAKSDPTSNYRDAIARCLDFEDFHARYTQAA